ncbi:methyl-accepting chemotaxis protein [Azospira restricta]|uniref:Methyl-accepting chemotaxis protein n=1 Tax=Azospira restricta TaxID=404405 RepID=A0A974PWF2_9RHOO|nr:methyl-accepting chemotaxis protein [Azospira restricta]QRJ62464.1 methyl-accepting chemotaxis protein [Azospira restricta]
MDTSPASPSTPPRRPEKSHGAARALLAGALALAAGGTLALAASDPARLLWWSAAAFLLAGALWSGVSLLAELRRWNAAVLDFSTRLEDGDLTARIEVARHGLHAPLAERLNATARALARVFVTLSRSAHELSSVAHETTSNAAGGDEGVRTQRDVTLTSAATIEQLSVSVATTSEHATTAADTALETSAAAGDAARRMALLSATLTGLIDAVGDTAERAERLGAHSLEIDSIVAMISEVAEQTNLLALNAAIEAARAGEAGRGFAVVADEVRKLAERTRLATREIGERIGGIRDEIGVMVAAMRTTSERAGASGREAAAAEADIARVADNTGRTRDLVGEIAAACAEQSAASQSVAQNIEQVAQLADRNEALVRENSELSRYLDQLAGQLAATLQDYRYE